MTAIPNDEPKPITKTDEIRRPNRPPQPLSPPQVATMVNVVFEVTAEFESAIAKIVNNIQYLRLYPSYLDGESDDDGADIQSVDVRER